MDMKLEVVVLPVSDVDKAKDSYQRLGWRLDANFARGDYRVVQLTPPGSACSIIFGAGVTSAAPGSAQGLQLVVPDIESARAELAGRGAQVSEVFHDVTGVFHQAFVEVNEEGTEAAAATAVVVGMAMARPEPPVPEFRADHPFIFLIQDDGTGAILFLGRVTDPAG